MKNRMIVWVMAVLLAVSVPFQTKAANIQFPDVKGHWAKEEIMYLYNNHIIGGYPDGTFKPNEPITRAQAAAMLIKALHIPLTDKTAAEFKDVPKTSPYYKILATVNEKEILRGDNGYMRPGEKTSRAQMAAILRRAFELPLDKQATFVDVTPSHWAYQDINGIAKARLAGGSKGKYMPSQSVTRAQFSAFLVRALDDDMKLGNYHSYVGNKGTTVEQDDFFFTIVKTNEARFQLIKENKKTGNNEVLLDTMTLEKEDFFQVMLMDRFPLVVYNETIYIPYWFAVGEMSELPLSYGLMKVDTNGENFSLMEKPNGLSFRNLYIWNDRMYYTREQNKDRYFDYTFNPTVPVDDPLVLYSSSLDGSDEKRESAFNARVIFDELSFTPKHVHVNQNNKSVRFDHSTMYYFNKNGVFAYNLLNGKTTKLSSILAKDMDVTAAHLEVTDQKGKKHKVKK